MTRSKGCRASRRRTRKLDSREVKNTGGKVTSQSRYDLTLGQCPWRTNRWRPSSVSLSAWQLSKLETSASTACARSARAPLRKTQRISKSSWLRELENISLGHGVSLLCWRSGGLEHPHDTPPYPLTPSPTFAHSSRSCQLNPCILVSQETSEIPLSSTGALHAKIGRRDNAVELVRDALPLPAKTAYFPVVTGEGMLSCRTAACNNLVGAGFGWQSKGL